MPRVIERHQDYIISAGAIANGAMNRDIRLQFDADAPFALRGIGGYYISAAPQAVSLDGGSIRFSDAEDNWLATNRLGKFGWWNTRGDGRYGLYHPLWPQQMYPALSTIRLELQNQSGADWPNTKIVLRGTKLFHEGLIWSPSYPACYRSIPFWQKIQFSIAANQTLRDIPLTGPFDADLALRFATLDRNLVVAGSFENLGLKLKDNTNKPYSNDYINARWLFPGFDTTPERPGIYYPEIYLPRTQQLFVDAQQAEAQPAQMFLVLMGAKIFPEVGAQ